MACSPHAIRRLLLALTCKRVNPACKRVRRSKNPGSTSTGNAAIYIDPPLTLKGNIVLRNLDDAACFIVGYHEARRPALQSSVLRRLEEAIGEAEERDAGYAFRGWVEVERLILKSDERPGNEARK
jgi:hypothetical protein